MGVYSALYGIYSIVCVKHAIPSLEKKRVCGHDMYVIMLLVTYHDGYVSTHVVRFFSVLINSQIKVGQKADARDGR